MRPPGSPLAYLYRAWRFARRHACVAHHVGFYGGNLLDLYARQETLQREGVEAIIPLLHVDEVDAAETQGAVPGVPSRRSSELAGGPSLLLQS